MKIKGIFSILTVLCLGASMCGCSLKNSSESDSDSNKKSVKFEKEKEKEKDFELPENIVYCVTEDELFEFAVSEDTPDGISNEHIDTSELEFVFNLGDEDTLIGVMTIAELHQTAEGFVKTISSDFEESELYSNIITEKLTINDNPAFRLTADCENDLLYTMTTVQFGNGDIFVATSTSTPENREACDRETEIILNSIEYMGKPLKTEPETYENNYFSITISEDWYFRKTTDDFASIALNLQNSIDDAMYGFSFSALPDETDIKQIINDAKVIYKHEVGFLCDKAEYMGFEAEHFHYRNSLDAYVDNYIFEKDGVIYQATEICSVEKKDTYKNDIKKVIDNIEFKK